VWQSAELPAVLNEFREELTRADHLARMDLRSGDAYCQAARR
jgi:hypothetical protein